MSSSIVETQKLNAFYGDAQVLFDIDFHLNKGEIIGILGANGAGKSSFLKSLTGLIQVEPDSVMLYGKPIGSSPVGSIVKKGLALVPEGRRLFPSMAVEENLLMGSFAARKGKWNLAEIYKLFPVLKEKRKVPSTLLSGGQQQMVAIGRALMSNPDILLCDEISLGLAPVIIKDIYDSLPMITSEGMSVVIVEQDSIIARKYSNRLYCFQEGKISLEGKSEDLTQDQISQAYFGI